MLFEISSKSEKSITREPTILGLKLKVASRAAIVPLAVSLLYINTVGISNFIGLLYSFSVKNVVNFVFNILFISSILSSSYVSLWRRKKILAFCKELISVTKSLDIIAYQNLARRCQLALLILTIYSIMVAVLGGVYSLDESVNYFDLFDLQCFWCRDSNVSVWWVDAYRLVDFTIFAFGSVAFTGVMGIFYAFQASMLTIIGDTIARNPAKFSAQSTRRRSQQLFGFIEKMNALYQDIMFVWYSCTLLCTCEGIVRLFNFRRHQSVVFLAYIATLHFQDNFTLTCTTLVSSRLPYVLTRALKRLSTYVETSLVDGSYSELQFTYAILNRPHGLRIGGCIVITRNLLLSFAGLAATYAVVFLQLSPEALNKLNVGNATYPI